MTKMVVIGIDAASYSLIERWKDFLPNLSRMMKNGAYGILRSAIPPDSCPAWPCFYTGKNPGKIGIYDFVVISDDGTTRVVDSTACDSVTIWEILSRFDKRVCVLQVPITYPPREVNGYMVSCFLSPWLRKNYTFPLYLHKELEKIWGGGYPNPIITTAHGREEAYLNEISRVHSMQVRAAKHFLRKEDWDFFMVYFRALDLIQHHFWKYMDTKYLNNKHRRYANVIRDWYVKMDETVGEIMNELDDDYVVIVSDHGCQAARYVVYINEWLMQHGLLRFLSKKNNTYVPLHFRLKNFILRHFSPYLVIRFLKIIPKSFWSKMTSREVIKSSIDQILSSIDWSHTKVYALGGTNASLYINLKGRNPRGIVDPGKEYESLRNLIIERLKEFPQTETNKKIYACIKKKEEIYWGKHADMAPDLAVDFFVDDSKCIVSLKAGNGKIVDKQSLWVSGTHSDEGIWSITGPGVKKSTRVDADIVDLAPTILYLLDTPIPEDIDGKVLGQGLSLSKEPQYQKPLEAISVPQTHYSTDEQEELKKRLRALGYID